MAYQFWIWTFWNVPFVLSMCVDQWQNAVYFLSCNIPCIMNTKVRTSASCIADTFSGNHRVVEFQDFLESMNLTLYLTGWTTFTEQLFITIDCCHYWTPFNINLEEILYCNVCTMNKTVYITKKATSYLLPISGLAAIFFLNLDLNCSYLTSQMQIHLYWNQT